MKCPYCAEEIQPDAKKCRFCKEWLEPQQTDGSKEAPDIEDPLASVQALFASPSTADAPSTVATPSPSTAPVATPAPRQIQNTPPSPKPCPHCGFAATTSGHFCGKCGKLLNTKPQPLTSPALQHPSASPRLPLAPPSVDNTSGQGKAAVVPPEIRHFNWGAFLWSWRWARVHRLRVGWLTLLPGIGVLMWFALGFKGNEWAWRHCRWDSLAQYQEVQRHWKKSGLVSLLVICLLGALGVQVALSAITYSSERNLRVLASAVQSYRHDHKGVFPPMEASQGMQEALAPYLGDAARSEDALLGAPIYRQPNVGSSYGTNESLSGRNESEVTSPSSMLLLYEQEPRIDGKRSLAFVDGHVELVGTEQWRQIQGSSTLPPHAAEPEPVAEPQPEDSTAADDSPPEGGSSSSGIRTPDFDLPTLIGLSESQLRSALGQALGRMQGNLCWENGSILVAVRKRGGTTIIGFLLIIPTDMTGNEDAALALGNLSRDDPRYSVEVEHDAENNQSRVSVFLR